MESHEASARKGRADERALKGLSGVTALPPVQTTFDFSASAAVERAEINLSETLSEHEDAHAAVLVTRSGFSLAPIRKEKRHSQRGRF